jgi:hypothetical protein
MWLLYYIRVNASSQVHSNSLLIIFLLVLFFQHCHNLIILLRNAVT